MAIIVASVEEDITKLIGEDSLWEYLIYGAYGLSGSGKTYTLIEQSNTDNIFRTIIEKLRIIPNLQFSVTFYDYYGEIFDPECGSQYKQDSTGGAIRSAAIRSAATRSAAPRPAAPRPAATRSAATRAAAPRLTSTFQSTDFNNISPLKSLYDDPTQLVTSKISPVRNAFGIPAKDQVVIGNPYTRSMSGIPAIKVSTPTTLVNNTPVTPVLSTPSKHPIKVPNLVVDSKITYFDSNGTSTTTVNEIKQNYYDVLQKVQQTRKTDMGKTTVTYIKDRSDKSDTSTIKYNEYHIRSTPNNAESSRAYLGIDININIKDTNKKITIIDMPGSETVDDIQNFYFKKFPEDKENDKTEFYEEINGKKNDPIPYPENLETLIINIKNWNNLLNDIIDAKYVNTFKSRNGETLRDSNQIKVYLNNPKYYNNYDNITNNCPLVIEFIPILSKGLSPEEKIYLITFKMFIFQSNLKNIFDYIGKIVELSKTRDIGARLSSARERTTDTFGPETKKKIIDRLLRKFNENNNMGEGVTIAISNEKSKTHLGKTTIYYTYSLTIDNKSYELETLGNNLMGQLINIGKYKYGWQFRYNEMVKTIHCPIRYQGNFITDTLEQFKYFAQQLANYNVATFTNNLLLKKLEENIKKDTVTPEKTKLVLFACVRTDLMNKDGSENSKIKPNFESTLKFAHCLNPFRIGTDCVDITDDTNIKIDTSIINGKDPTWVKSTNLVGLYITKTEPSGLKFWIPNWMAPKSGGGEIIHNALLKINPHPSNLYLYSWIFAIFMFIISSVYTTQQLYTNALIPQNQFYMCSSFILELVAFCAFYALIANNIELFMRFLIFFTLFATIYVYNIPEDFKNNNKILYSNLQYSMLIIWVLTLFLTGFVAAI